MRPIKLTMTAMGPYRDSETIDFTALGDKRLFVISGNTGAGKTTIFDAICYALYDTASGEDRAETRMLRSHYASEDTHTSVDFTFAVGSRCFRIFRQMKHRKGANKSETGDKIEFYERIDGKEVPAVDRFIVSEVNEKIKSILGLTKEQFSQIVMLPQGEFRKLLTSDTDNKEEILRHIFGTGLYERLEARFQQMSKELRDKHRDALSDLTMRLTRVQEVLPLRESSLLAGIFQQPSYNAVQVLEGLAEEHAYYMEMVQSGEAQQVEANAELEAKELALRAAVLLNRRFDELTGKRELLAQLELQKPSIVQREEQLKLAAQAARIEPYEERVEQYKLELAKKQEAYAQTQQIDEAVRKQLAKAEARFKEEEARQDEGKRIELELIKLKEWVPAVQKLDELQGETIRLSAEERRLSSFLIALGERLAENRSERKAVADRLKELERESEQYAERVSELEQVQREIRLLQDLIELDRQLADWLHLESMREQEWQAAKAEHDALEQLWMEGQAGWLAAHLHDGSPCPVCGSKEHPSLARASEQAPSREYLQQAKEKLRHVESELNDARAQAAASRTAKDIRMKDVLGSIDEAVQDWSARLVKAKEQEIRLVQETERLRRIRDELPKARGRAEELDRSYEEGDKEKQELEARKHELAVAIGRKQSLLEQECERIPEELRDPAVLAARILALTNEREAITQAYQLALQHVQQLRTRAAEEGANKDQLLAQVEETKEKLTEAVQRMDAELSQAKFPSFEAYKASQLPQKIREAYQEEIDSYQHAVRTLQAQIIELEKGLTGTQRADLDALELAVAAAKAHRDRIQAELLQAGSYLAETKRLCHMIQEAELKMKQLEEELEQVQDLFLMMKGDNPLKISFERYILIEYLEQILHAANERLDRLSGGQFRLERSDRLESRGKQSGLGLDVYDAYTGQRRDVKSLSGGEKFNASLSLALGMTDVIQAHQGGVSIEMMFIDEGFGSLDEDALNKAVMALIDVQQTGRMIGVISHVQELKQAFPAVLEVFKTKEGISKTRVILKS